MCDTLCAQNRHCSFDCQLQLCLPPLGPSRASHSNSVRSSHLPRSTAAIVNMTCLSMQMCSLALTAHGCSQQTLHPDVLVLCTLPVHDCNHIRYNIKLCLFHTTKQLAPVYAPSFRNVPASTIRTAVPYTTPLRLPATDHSVKSAVMTVLQ